MSFLKIHIFCGYVTARFPVRRPIDHQRSFHLDEKRKLKTSMLHLSIIEEQIWQLGIRIDYSCNHDNSTNIHYHYMLKIDWEKVFEKYVGEGERKR